MRDTVAGPTSVLYTASTTLFLQVSLCHSHEDLEGCVSSSQSSSPNVKNFLLLWDRKKGDEPR